MDLVSFSAGAIVWGTRFRVFMAGAGLDSHLTFDDIYIYDYQQSLPLGLCGGGRFDQDDQQSLALGGEGRAPNHHGCWVVGLLGLCCEWLWAVADLGSWAVREPISPCPGTTWPWGRTYGEPFWGR